MENKPTPVLKNIFNAIDFFQVVLGAILGAAIGYVIQYYSKETSWFLLFSVVLLFAFGIIFQRLANQANKLLEHQINTSETVVKEMLDKREKKIEGMLSKVHASVKFEKESNERAAYLAAKSAVESASNRILVVGDYSPPVKTSIDVQPQRNEYLSFIAKKIQDCVGKIAGSQLEGTEFRYVRIIQRPPELFEYLSKASEGGSIVLKKDYMKGDEQMFEHIKEIFDLPEKLGEMKESFHSDILITSFLPNCPSILVVDDSNIQFTIPFRETKTMGDFGIQKLYGVLRMNDFKKGNELADEFANLIDDKLRRHSLTVTGVSEDNDSNISNETGLPTS